MDKITQIFTNKIKEKLSNHLKNMYLYGSRARGDYTERSDYDFMIVVDKRDKNIVDIITDETVNMLNDYSELVSAIIYEEEEWEFKKYIPLGRNILKEGIAL
mgnify:CR=1 FL=1